MQKWLRFILAFTILALLLPMMSVQAATEKVTLQLKWKHQFQFAGYYAALEKGYYKEAGFDVNLKEVDISKDPIDQVIHGEAEFGSASAELVQRRSQGDPVVVLGVVFQHSPLVLIAHEDEGISNLHDLKGKKIMLETQSAEIYAYLNMEGITKDQMEVVPHSYNLKDFIERRVDAVSVYTTDELYVLNHQGIAVHVFQPRANGIDFYGDVLFTTEAQIKKDPKRVQAFRDASMRGWKYAMEHTDEIIDLIISKYSKLHSKEELQDEARKMQILLQPELIEPGYSNRDRWEHMVATFKDMGMISKAEFPMDAFLFEKEDTYKLPHWVKNVLIILACILLPLMIITVYISRMNRNLRFQIKKRQQAEDDLEESEVRLKLLVESTDELIVMFDLEGKCIYFNGSLKYGIDAGQLIGKTHDEWIKSELYSVLFKNVHNVIQDGNKMSDEFSVELNGEFVWFSNNLYPVRNAKQQMIAVAFITRDITERKISEEKLDYMAQYDSLTGLLNRNSFYERLAHDMSISARNQQQLALLFIDLDSFKEVNDNYGHKTGDELLKEVAQRLTSSVRESDTVMRLAGDEFVIILMNLKGKTEISRITELILQNVCASISIEDKQLQVTASIGISIYPEDGIEAEELLNRADSAMYDSKKSGVNNYSYYRQE
ncbi:diguanylate cyclase [Paenibacillus psychroresistens]|uniref:Diguanylate cyclase n=1 Tax=Paenibacillus psychroresistens TaxID=1778678 RepID=A0A6B8RN57_9BACL|nr:diguanylate cyclase [Paenibacillus psychroresistens]QGQ97277.1 diguanylate cyclase [Paenibacillus psychroresistens]